MVDSPVMSDEAGDARPQPRFPLRRGFALPRLLCLALLLTGLLISGYLLLRHSALATRVSHNAPDICSAFWGASCDAALLNPLSRQLGLPLAGWAIVFYGTLLSLLLLGWTLGSAFHAEATLAALVVAVVGALLSLLLMGSMVFGAAPFCPLCIVLQAINFVLVPLVIWQAGLGSKRWLSPLVAARDYLLGRDSSDPQQARWKVVGLLIPGLVAVVLYQWAYIEANPHGRSRGNAFDPEETLATFEASREHEIPVGPDDPQLGLNDAPARLVVFSDLQCPGCRRFAHDLPELMQRFDGRLHVVFKHWPLGTACNDALTRDLHPQACAAASAAVAAHRQDRFWAFQDEVFTTNLRQDDETILHLVEQLEMDAQQFERDVADAATAEKIKSDVELGKRLGVDATPSLFLNGRRLPDNRPQTIRLLIAHEVERKSK